MTCAEYLETASRAASKAETGSDDRVVFSIGSAVLCIVFLMSAGEAYTNALKGIWPEANEDAAPYCAPAALEQRDG